MPKPGVHKQVLKYGLLVPTNKDPLDLEFLCIRMGGRWKGPHGDWCGKGMAYHVKEAKKLIWPNEDRHRWTHLITDTWLQSPGRTGIFGPSSSSKSWTTSRDALVMFYANPHKTTVLISSTTRDALTRRIWDYVVSSDKLAREERPWLPGSLIESKLMLLADDKAEEGRSFKNGIVGVPCKSGGQWNGIEAYVGCKNEVVIVIADELQFVPVGVLDALANLESNERCYFVGMGNLPDVFNPLGSLCEPKLGWDSLPDTEKSRVYETKWKNGRAVQLIGMDSPNLDYPEGQEPFKNLIGRRYIEQCAQNYGRESDKFNMFASGKIPRASMNRTVFTKAQCIKFNASDSVTWGHGKVTRGYGMDAAYSGVGGDRTVGFPFIFGIDNQNQWKLWLGPMKIYPGSDTPKLSHAEAIALQCKSECEAHGIPPEHVFFDGTGRSELTSAFARLWSPKVVPIEFGGPATERPAFTGEKHMDGEREGEIKMCREVFDRFVTELWFAIRHCIVADQMRGLPQEVIDEGSQRKWELVRGNKYSIETKDDMKERGLRSPDLCDAVVAACEGARRLGFPLGKHTPPGKRGNKWLEAMSEQSWQDARKEELAA